MKMNSWWAILNFKKWILLIKTFKFKNFKGKKLNIKKIIMSFRIRNYLNLSMIGKKCTFGCKISRYCHYKRRLLRWKNWRWKYMNSKKSRRSWTISRVKKRKIWRESSIIWFMIWNENMEKLISFNNRSTNWNSQFKKL